MRAQLPRRLGAFLVSRLVEEAEHLATNLLPTSLLVVHDAGRGGHHDLPEQTRGQQAADPVLDLGHLKVVARADHAALVEAAVELNHDLATTVVIDELELTNVAVL